MGYYENACPSRMFRLVSACPSGRVVSRPIGRRGLFHISLPIRRWQGMHVRRRFRVIGGPPACAATGLVPGATRF